MKKRESKDYGDEQDHPQKKRSTLSTDQHRSDKEQVGSSRDSSPPVTPARMSQTDRSAAVTAPAGAPTIPRRYDAPEYHQYPYYPYRNAAPYDAGTRSPASSSSPSAYMKQNVVTASPQSTVFHEMSSSSTASYPRTRQESYTDSRSRTSADYQSPRTPGAEGSIMTPVLQERVDAMQYHSEGPPQYRPSRNLPYTAEISHKPLKRGKYKPSDDTAAYPTPPRLPRTWACDYCRTATFLTFEDACAHEETCSKRKSDLPGRRARDSANAGPPRPTDAAYKRGVLDTPYHAGDEMEVEPQSSVATRERTWPPIVIPPPRPVGIPAQPARFERFHPRGYEGRREQPFPPHAMEPVSRTMLLAMPRDSDSLSDRQCFVRSKFVEVFAATAGDVASRHSKGAQKLVVGQVGIRCIYCSHLQPKDRSERAICYPSSISRIYQTVADMQRFHFESCSEIPDDIRRIYKSLKTTRPRGVGSPQTYWIQSARLLNLVDTDEGIRFGDDPMISHGDAARK